MPFTVTETLTSLSYRITAKGKALHTSLLIAFARIAIGLQAYIKTQKLQGQVLAHRSGKLTRSIEQQVVDQGRTFTAVVQAGSLAPYGAIHEYGGTFQIPEHMSHSRLSQKTWTVRSHTATFPERSFMRSSLKEYRDQAYREIENAISGSL